MVVDPEIGFTADVIRDPGRFVGRTNLIRNCIYALNSPTGLIGVYGKRGVGKSSLLRQLQQIALGEYSLAKHAGLSSIIPERPRTYLTAYYSCDSFISDGKELVKRLCNDQDEEDGLLRLVPNDGKQIVEFQRSKEVSGGVDLKVANWGCKGIESSKYAKVIPDDPMQTFRNFMSAIIKHQVKDKMRRDGLLILLDEFDVVQDKEGIGSIIKSLTTPEVKFAVCGIGRDLSDLVHDHASVERLLEQGALHVEPMPLGESTEIILRANKLFNRAMYFDTDVTDEIAQMGQGYPYFVQLIGKECVQKANFIRTKTVDIHVLNQVKDDLREGRSFPTLESAYKRAIGNSDDRQTLLHLLAEQDSDYVNSAEVGSIALKKTRQIAEDFNIKYMDQLIPRLVDKKYGPTLEKVADRQGTYEFVNPVLRQYIRLRKF